ncbi:hypothetical protein SASPL_146525 [Salvia splendens]|uniref:CRIB domain-containing protein n=1 Tax=Salvia splendens TaxID=180675 RepID=A0A8X8Z5V0_SALSN|nr:hypothetical protein SASPL_146525 [Salvia splendens]
MKGLYKGFKYTISQFFVVKERELEIGYPTDVKHVAHIGWDGSTGTAPSWMSEFKTGPDFAATSIGNSGSALSPWSSQGVVLDLLSRGVWRLVELCLKKTAFRIDFGESMRQQSGSEMFRDMASSEKKKDKRKKSKSTSSPNSISGSSSRSAAKSSAKFIVGLGCILVLKPKNPKITMQQATLKHISFGSDFQINVTLGMLVTVNNPNHASFRYENSTAFVSYRGAPVAEAPIQEDAIPARGSHDISTDLFVDGDRVVANPGFMEDLAARRFNFTSSTTLHGRAKVLNLFKITATTNSTCVISVDVDAQNATSLCNSKFNY